MGTPRISVSTTLNVVPPPLMPPIPVFPDTGLTSTLPETPNAGVPLHVTPTACPPSTPTIFTPLVDTTEVPTLFVMSTFSGLVPFSLITFTEPNVTPVVFPMFIVPPEILPIFSTENVPPRIEILLRVPPLIPILEGNESPLIVMPLPKQIPTPSRLTFRASPDIPTP